MKRSSKIPRKFMQTLFGFDEVPPKWQPSIDSVHRLMPFFDHTVVHGSAYEAFVKLHFPDFLETFLQYPYDIQRADAIRYMWLYVHGGLYMDLDMEILRDLSPLMEGCDLVLVEDMPGTTTDFSNCLMASVPGHPFWLDCLKLMKERAGNWYGLKVLDTVNKTGPGILQEVAKNYKGRICIIPAVIANSCHVCNGTCPSYPNAFVRQLPGSGGSWISSMDSFFIKLWCVNKVYILLVIIIMSVGAFVVWRMKRMKR